MTGVELALAILPVVISTAEHYHGVYEAYSRYKNFAPILNELQESLQIRRTISYNDSTILLALCVPKDQAKDMLDNPQHSSWADEALEQALASQLGSSASSCIMIMRSIEKKLQEIEGQEQKFGQVLSENPKVRARFLWMR
jgi:hypothetical protein